MGDCRMHEEATVKIACIQMEPIVGEKERNVQRSLGLIEEAAVKNKPMLATPDAPVTAIRAARPTVTPPIARTGTLTALSGSFRSQRPLSRDLRINWP